MNAITLSHFALVYTHISVNNECSIYFCNIKSHRKTAGDDVSYRACLSMMHAG